MVDWVQGSDGLFYGVYRGMVVGVEEMDGHNEEIMADGREDVGGHNEEVMAEGRGDVDGLEEEVAAVTGEGGVEEIDRSMEREDRTIDKDDEVRSMYLHDDCLPHDQLTWEIMFDKVENMNWADYEDSEENVMSVLSVPASEEEVEEK